MGALRFENLTKIYQEGERRRVVLNQASGEIAKGEFISILGRSGSGKSTLLNLISGIDVADSGSIWLGDQELTRMNDLQRTLFRRRKIGFIFQFFNLIPTLTVWENVSLPVDLADLPRREKRARYSSGQQLLDEVGLLERRDIYPDRLSGGEQQRVSIVRSLIHDPDLILADEPTGNLDEETGALVLDLLETLSRKSGKTLLMVTHSQEAAARADRVFHLRDGKLERHVFS